MSWGYQALSQWWGWGYLAEDWELEQGDGVHARAIGGLRVELSQPCQL